MSLAGRQVGNPAAGTPGDQESSTVTRRERFSCHVRATSSAGQCIVVQTHAQRIRGSTRPFSQLWLALQLPLSFFPS
jgi:hypothetical protein